MKSKWSYFLLVTSLAATSIVLSAHAQTKNNAHDHAHDHHHQPPEKVVQASKGIFEDKDVKERALSDWAGQWQSVYPILLAGDLDVVMKDKAAKNPDKTFEEYKFYYNKGYQTEIATIGIEGKQVTFSTQNTASTCEYVYSGFKILTYTSGKRGVRYLFECQQKDSGAPQFIQFSDHIIEPTKSEHYHIYMGNESHEKLFLELDNWPTYYSKNLSQQDIVKEMLHH